METEETVEEITDDQELQARLLADCRWVSGAASRLGVSIGTFVQMQVETWFGSAGRQALSHVYAALHLDEPPLHAAIIEGNDAEALRLLAKCPKHAQLKHRGKLPLHALIERVAQDEPATFDPDTGELFVKPTPAETAALLQELVAAYPASLDVRTDTNWGLGHADGHLPLQLAVGGHLDGWQCEPTASKQPAITDAALASKCLSLNVHLFKLVASYRPKALDMGGCRLRSIHPDNWTLRGAIRSLQATVGARIHLCSEDEEMLDQLGGALELVGLLDTTLAESTDDGSNLPDGASGSKASGGSGGGTAAASVRDVDVAVAVGAEAVHYGKDWRVAEFQTLLSVERLGELLGVDFFNSYSDEFAEALFAACAQIRMADCLNSPARLVAEAATGDNGEIVLETILESIGGDAASFLTEEDIKDGATSERDLRATPDILFMEAVILPGVCDMPIRWIDSKGGWVSPKLSLPGKVTSVQRQATKYEATFGPGLFVWHRGFFESICDLTTTNIFHCALNVNSTCMLPALPGTQTLHSRAVSIPSGKVGKLIGKEGSNVKQLSIQYNITVDIPPPEEIVGDECTVTVRGFDIEMVVSAVDSIRSYTNQTRGGRRGHGSRNRSAASPTKSNVMVPDAVAKRHTLNRRKDGDR